MFRIVCVGGSTTYGGKTDHATFLEEQLRTDGYQVEVLNAGVPGWTSRESLINFELRVLPMQPDLVIVYHGRNDLFPQLYDNFEIDYSHFRDWTYDFTATNRDLKRWFGRSRTFMLFGLAFPTISGWDEVAEHPIYGSVRLENRPLPERAVRNLNDPTRTHGFTRNNEQLISLASSHGADVVLATFAFRPDKPLRAQLNRNNDVLRQLAANGRGVFLAETAALAEREDVFVDDCHVKEEGHKLRAEILFATLKHHDLLPPPR